MSCYELFFFIRIIILKFKAYSEAKNLGIICATIVTPDIDTNNAMRINIYRVTKNIATCIQQGVLRRAALAMPM